MNKISDISQLKKYYDRIKKMTINMPSIMNELGCKEAEVIIGQVKQRTPVNQGLLRESWHSNVIVKKDCCEVVIMNNLEYASLIEKGFRAHYVPGYWSGSNFVYVRYDSSIADFNKKYPGMYVGNRSTGWQQGKFMMMKGCLYYKHYLMNSRQERFWLHKLEEYLGA